MKVNDPYIEKLLKSSKKTFNNITVSDCKEFLKIEDDYFDDDDIIRTFLLSAKSLLLEQCNNDLELLEEKAFYSVNLVYYMVSEMYHKREITTSTMKTNPMFKLMMDNVRCFNVK